MAVYCPLCYSLWFYSHQVTINERTVRYNSSDTQVSFTSDGFYLFNNVFNNATIVVMNSVGLSKPHIQSFFGPSEF